MLIEREESVTLEEGVALGDLLIGGLWTTFRNAIPDEQSKILDRGFNLIMLADEDSLLPAQLTGMLLDEYQDTPTKKISVFTAITTNIIVMLEGFGIVLNEDEAGENKLTELVNMVDFFFDLNDYQDLIGLKGLLESQDIPPVNRFLEAMVIFYGDDFNISEYELLLVDVSEVTIKTIKDALFSPDDTVNPPSTLVNRVIANKHLLEGTRAYTHVINNGQIGGSVASFMAFFQDHLEELLEAETENETLQYAREIIGIFLISEVNDGVIVDKVTKQIYSVVTDAVTMLKVDRLIKLIEFPA